jgi:mannitol/fructose-specific phosphotransferase system IIA component
MRLLNWTCALTLLAATATFAQTGRLRVVHASPDAPAVDVYVDGAKVLENLPYREYSEYLPLPAGTHEVRVNVTNTQTTVLQAAPSIQSGADYTAIAVGLAGGGGPGLDLVLLADDNTMAAGGNVKLRVVHGAPSAPEVDVYVTTPFESLDNRTPALTNVPFKAASGYIAVPPQMYQARVAVAGTKTIAIDSHRLVTWGGIVRTVIAVDAKNGGAPFDFIILPDLN